MSAILLQSCACAAKVVKCSCDVTASTNCQDVMIAAIICGTIVIIALIVKCGILIWKGKDLAEKEKERQEKKTRETAECDRKKAADEETRRQLLEDEARKKKADLLDKYLVYLSEQSEGKDDRYRKTLEYLIQLSQKDKLAEFSIEYLNNLFKEPSADENQNT